MLLDMKIASRSWKRGGRFFMTNTGCYMLLLQVPVHVLFLTQFSNAKGSMSISRRMNVRDSGALQFAGMHKLIEHGQ